MQHEKGHACAADGSGTDNKKTRPPMAAVPFSVSFGIFRAQHLTAGGEPRFSSQASSLAAPSAPLLEERPQHYRSKASHDHSQLTAAARVLTTHTVAWTSRQTGFTLVRTDSNDGRNLPVNKLLIQMAEIGPERLSVSLRTLDQSHRILRVDGEAGRSIDWEGSREAQRIQRISSCQK
jgi:hypothetical protein